MTQHPGLGEGRTIILPALFDRQAAADLLPQVRAAVGGGPVLLDGSRVERIGQAGLQLVLATLRTGPDATLRRGSAALCAAAALAGVDELPEFAGMEDAA